MAITQIKLTDNTIDNINDYRLPSTLGMGGQVLKMNSEGTAIVWGSGASQGQIVVTSIGGATVSINTDSYTYETGETSHTFGPYDYGTYIVSATKTGMYEKQITVALTQSSVSTTCIPTKLPSTFTELSYIETTGTQYINTEVLPTANISLTFKFGRVLLPTSGNGLLGAPCYGARFTYVNQIIGGVGTYSWSGSNITQQEINTLYMSETSNTFNGTSVSFYTGSDYDTSQYIWLSASKFQGSIEKASTKLYECKIYNNGTPMRTLIPASRNSDSVIGMYDTVNNRFFINAGTGSFVPGDPV